MYIHISTLQITFILQAGVVVLLYMDPQIRYLVLSYYHTHMPVQVHPSMHITESNTMYRIAFFKVQFWGYY